MSRTRTAPAGGPSQADLDAAQKRREMYLPSDQKITFFNRASTSVEAGTSIPDFLRGEEKLLRMIKETNASALAFLLSGKPSPSTGAFITELTHMVCDLGFDFSKAALQFPGIFDQHLLALLHAAEKSGEYAPVLRRYVANLQQQKETRDAVIGAMIYPAMVIVVGILVVAIFLIWVIPAFSSIYEGLLGPGESLPWMTVLVFDVSQLVAKYWYALGLGLAGSVAGYVWLRSKGSEVKLKEHEFLLRTPVLGAYFAQLDAVNYLSTFTMLRHSGALMTESAELAADSLMNLELRDAARRAVDTFTAGKVSTLAQALAVEHPVFSVASSFYNEMLSYERTGTIEALENYASLLKHNANQTRLRLLAIMPIFTIVILGGLVGFLVMSMYLPLFELIGKLALK
ncbi:MAG: type II secretion system F family protein [Blastocatellia bacterium]|nr:type II secretion system F family protein [Blastocatellia bacterium]